jgi:[acyl-carrier-protein] S-malonyltransferase
MDRKAMLFPGQGAQYPGMGKDFCEAFPEADEMFLRASEALSFDLKKICFEGSDEEVNRTDICQPAILTTSIAILTVLEKRFGLGKNLFSATAGLSLGEYTALVFADVLSFEDAVRLVGKRGRYMQEDSDRTPSGMMSLIGATAEQAETIAAECSSRGVLVAANYLSPSQTVISGALEALDEAESRLKEFGVRRGMRAKVAGAFHSPLMAEGGAKLKADLEAAEFRKPLVPFASNVTGGYVTDPDEIRRCLAAQVTSPVLWSKTMKRFGGDGVSAFFEPGPGRVLCGIIKKIDRKLLTHNLDEPGGIDSFVAGYKEESGVVDALSGKEGGGAS